MIAVIIAWVIGIGCIFLMKKYNQEDGLLTQYMSWLY